MALASVVSLWFCEYNQHASPSEPLHLLLCFFCLDWSSIDICIICSLISFISLSQCLLIKKDFPNVSILYHHHLTILSYWHSLPYDVYLSLSRFSHVRLLATPWTAAYQAPPSMGFFRQEYWSGVPLPSPSIYLLPPNSILSYWHSWLSDIIYLFISYHYNHH